MPKLKTSRKIKVAARAAKNMMIGRPITVSFEVTFNCNANCRHCNWGEYVKEPRLGPEVWGNRLAELKPVVAQISGGEPLLRKDLYDIIAEMRRRDPLAVFVLTTNVQIMNEERYARLREVGVDEFSFSLDYPDERHNDFRQLKDNFQHIRELVPKLAAQGNQDIVLACVVQSDNFRELPQIAQLAKDWGVCVNFSIYTHLRSGIEELTISPDGQLDELRVVIDRLIKMQDDGYPIATSPFSLNKIIEFYKTRSQPNCQAGRKFFIINPWGKLAPCGIIHAEYDSQDELMEKFTKGNRCDMCYTAIRANCEKSPSRMIADALRIVRKRK
jgi:MoaA/NifB/PqqE/SkfB family radical SAM enzyme